MKKVWIVGASGRVGSALLKQLDCLKYEIMVTDATEVDVTNREDVNSYMKISRPDVEALKNDTTIVRRSRLKLSFCGKFCLFSAV